MKNQDKPIHPAAKQNQFGQMEVMPGLTKLEFAIIHIVSNNSKDLLIHSIIDRPHKFKSLVHDSIFLAKEIFLQLEDHEKQEGNKG